MTMSIERRASGGGLSPREAAFVTGLPEKTINQAIDRAEVETLPTRRIDDRERMIAFPELVYLRLRGELGDLLSPEGKRKLRNELALANLKEEWDVLHIGPLEIRLAPWLGSVRERLREMERLWSFVTIDANVRAGEPVVRGTRIGIHALADLARQGASTQELLEDHPALTPESLEAALTWARMYPRRGRPPRTGWQGGTVIRRGT
jgi:uncharacterized protein (DUF433 family)